ncbi:MAG: hypothetical protein IKK82_04870 [Kiritimatiellae bacterium]|nr:hypothetical protein [Kiritimatiellia bacterium]
MMRMPRLVVCFVVLCLAATASAAEEISAETSEPRESCFVRGASASMWVRARGFAPGRKHPLKVEIANYKGVVVDECEEVFHTDADGSWEGSFDLPTEQFGCFRVSVSSGGCTLKKRGSRPAGLLTYAVLRDPATRPQIPWKDSFFGLYGGSDWIGARHKLDGRPPKSNPAEGRKAVETWCAKEGWKTWPILYWHDALFRPDSRTYDNGFWSDEARSWILGHVKKGDYSRNLVFGDKSGFAYLQEVLPKMVRAAREQTLPGQDNRLYEMMWEPDLGLDVHTVVKVAAALKAAIDREDPEGGVTCFPSVSNIRTLDYHRQLIDAGLLEHLNAYSIHPYIAYPPESNGLISNVRQLKRMIRDRIGRDLPLYGTEQGFAEPGTVEGELRKLNGLLRANFILLGEGFEKNLAFYGVDFGNDNGLDRDGDYGLFFNLELESKRYGVRFTSPRAVAAGLSAATWLVDGKRPTACLEGIWGPSSLGYCYADADDSCVIVLWDYGGKGGEAEIPVGRDKIVVADVMGNERVVSCTGGTLKLPLSETPVYVVGPDPKMWGRCGTEAKKLAAEAKRKAAEREARVKIRIHSVEPTFVGDVPAICADVENRTDAKSEIKVGTRQRGNPDARHTKMFSFLPKERRRVVVEMAGFKPGPFEELPLDVTAGFADGYVAELGATVNFWKAERIDGDPDAWMPCRRDDIGRAVWDERMAVPPPEDFSASVAFGWTDSELVGDFVVTDNVHTNGRTGFMSWNGDSVQLGIAKCALARLTGNYQSDMALQSPSEITLALAVKGPEAYRTITFDPKRFPAGHGGAGKISTSDVPLNVTRRGTATHYRFRLPWRFFGMERPLRGNAVRIAALFNDRDGKESLSQIRLFELKKEMPRRFGRLVLGGVARPNATAKVEGEAHLEFSGVIGQSAGDGASIPWIDCEWVVADKQRDVHFPGGVIFRQASGKVERIKSDVAGTIVSDGEGNLFAVRPQNGAVAAVEVGCGAISSGQTLFRTGGKNRVLHVAPQSCRKGFAANGRFFVLDKREKKVYGWTVSGEALGVVLDASVCSNRLESVAVCPSTGDILLGSGWPQCVVRRFSPMGKEQIDGLWPRRLAAGALQNLGGETWALQMGAIRVGRTLSQDEKLSLGCFSIQTRGVAFDGRGYWLATSQGAQRFLPDAPKTCLRRLGGMRDVTALAVAAGEVFAFSRWRILHFWLDDRADDAMTSDMNWGIAKTWAESVSGVDVKNGKLYIKERKSGRVIFLDPKITAYSDRAKRQYDVQGVEVCSTGKTALLGDSHEVRATPSGIELYRRNGDGDCVFVERTMEIASCVASEGNWLVAFIPKRNAIYRYRLSEPDRKGTK